MSQITDVSIVYSTVCLGADRRKHQNFASLAFVTDELPTQRASNTENISSWWCHHVVSGSWCTRLCTHVLVIWIECDLLTHSDAYKLNSLDMEIILYSIWKVLPTSYRAQGTFTLFAYAQGTIIWLCFEPKRIQILFNKYIYINVCVCMLSFWWRCIYKLFCYTNCAILQYLFRYHSLASAVA